MTAFAASKKFTLVIDAGHGGNDTGAVGAISKEKNLTLKFALAFGQMVERNCPDVKVLYTRKKDVFVELYRRAEIANQAKADLFISVHINALPKGRVAHGFQTYTLGTSKRTGRLSFRVLEFHSQLPTLTPNLHWESCTPRDFPPSWVQGFQFSPPE